MPSFILSEEWNSFDESYFRRVQCSFGILTGHEFYLLDTLNGLLLELLDIIFKNKEKLPKFEVKSVKYITHNLDIFQNLLLVLEN